MLFLDTQLQIKAFSCLIIIHTVAVTTWYLHFHSQSLLQCISAFPEIAAAAAAATEAATALSIPLECRRVSVSPGCSD